MTASYLASLLLKFIKQTEDFETHKVLKNFTHSRLAHEPKKAKEPVLKTQAPYIPTHTASSQKQPQESPKETKSEIKVETISIYARLADKVKKACPELRIKEHFDIKQAGIPDCDVVLLSGSSIADVYQSLAKAIDKQLALTEIIKMETALMSDLLTKSFKLILAAPQVKQIPGFMTQVKLTGKNKAYLGSSPLVFLEDADSLSQNIPLKQALWQTIKTFLT